MPYNFLVTRLRGGKAEGGNAEEGNAEGDVGPRTNFLESLRERVRNFRYPWSSDSREDKEKQPVRDPAIPLPPFGTPVSDSEDDSPPPTPPRWTRRRFSRGHQSMANGYNLSDDDDDDNDDNSEKESNAEAEGPHQPQRFHQLPGQRLRAQAQRRARHLVDLALTVTPEAPRAFADRLLLESRLRPAAERVIHALIDPNVRPEDEMGPERALRVLEAVGLVAADCDDAAGQKQKQKQKQKEKEKQKEKQKQKQQKKEGDLPQLDDAHRPSPEYRAGICVVETLVMLIGTFAAGRGGRKKVRRPGRERREEEDKNGKTMSKEEEKKAAVAEWHTAAREWRRLKGVGCLVPA
ncbi:hypothetical protein GGR56DRAFT_677275 [Xylariaceae sp. FL0804]|nr:hypothetical protein GGR56DRAFT_677275 [Xylariaceae sp. FL0804]